MDKRSHIYSDRPQVSHDIYLGITSKTTQLRYGAQWRMHSKLIQKVLKRDAAQAHCDTHLRLARALLSDLYTDPSNFEEHFHKLTASNILRITYGYDMISHNDRFCTPMIELVERLKAGMATFRMLTLSAFPILQEIPPWIPGASWQWNAHRLRGLTVQCGDEPFNWVQEQIDQGKTPPHSMVSDLLQDEDVSVDRVSYLKAIKDAAGTMFIAGFETTYTTLLAFFLTMALHPDVQKRAQEEIDKCIGQGNLPVFKNRDELPYTEAVLREVMRMYVMLPLGLPHSTSSEDVYDGFFIPKGTIILPNAWLMVREDSRWTNPDVFYPSRHLTASGDLASASTTEISGSAAFGFGRRKCPGRFMAENTLWISIASILAAFTITPAKGSEARRSVEMKDGFARTPVAFPCNIKPRMGYEELLGSQ